MSYFLTVIGMVMIIEGLPYFSFPEKAKKALASLLNMPDKSLRIFGLFMMVTGLVLVYTGKCILK